MGNTSQRLMALALLLIIAWPLLAHDVPANGGEEEGLPVLTPADWQQQLAFWKEEREKQAAERARQRAKSAAVPTANAGESVALLAPGTTGSSMSLDSVTVTGSDALMSESITNVQTAGIDEGGIVKQHGQHLVVLRRGRLFSIGLQEGQLKPIAMVDAYGPGLDDGWYDEMLISGNTIVVIGYNYRQRATGVGLFDIDDHGAIRYRDTYFLRSDDYYSSSNSASRLAGHTLLFYMPVPVRTWREEVSRVSPTIARWAGAGKVMDYAETLPISRIHRSRATPMSGSDSPTLHVLTRCDISQPQMHCESMAVLGSSSREFYVSRDAVYVWTGGGDEVKEASIFRMPLEAGSPQLLKASGGPIDQFSFLQGEDGYFNALVVSDSRGGGMWASETNEGDAALLRVPMSAFGGLESATRPTDYRALPPVPDYGSQNRFIGHWLIYGGKFDDASDGPVRQPVHALRYADNGPVQTLLLPHVLERIDRLGPDGILIGNDENEDLHFTSVRLGERAALASRFVQPDAAQGESRSHGFFYKPTDADSGIVGLPIMREAPAGMRRYLDESAGVIFLKNQNLRLSPLGTLDAREVSERASDDGCKASCLDWYGNARPLFIGDRIFALLGYELVEGRLLGNRIVERQRVDFSPAPRTH